MVTSGPARKALAVLRIGFGLTFLWAFFDKLLALGFSTGAITNEAGVKTGIGLLLPGRLDQRRQPDAGLPEVRRLRSLQGLLQQHRRRGLGQLGRSCSACSSSALTLTFGVAIRLGAVAGFVMYLMMWTRRALAGEQPASSTTTSSARSAWSVLGLTLAGDTWGLGKVLGPPAPRRTTTRSCGDGADPHGEDTAADSPVSSSGDTLGPAPLLGERGHRSARPRRARPHRRVVAGRELPGGRARSTCGQPAAHRAAAARAREAAAARPLRHRAGTQPRARARQPADHRARPRRGLRRRPRSRRPRPQRLRLARGHLLRALQPRPAGRGGHGGPVRPVLVPRRRARATAPRRRPGSFHEGGELGYSLLHAYGAVLDNPDLVAFCVVGDGEAETGPLATSWHCNTFLDPVRDGAVLPILHLNGYKIANPTLLARIPEEQLLELMRGYGYEPHVVAGDDPGQVHQRHGRGDGHLPRRHRRHPDRGPRRRRPRSTGAGR